MYLERFFFDAWKNSNSVLGFSSHSNLRVRFLGEFYEQGYRKGKRFVGGFIIANSENSVPDLSNETENQFRSFPRKGSQNRLFFVSHTGRVNGRGRIITYLSLVLPKRTTTVYLYLVYNYLLAANTYLKYCFHFSELGALVLSTSTTFLCLFIYLFTANKIKLYEAFGRSCRIFVCRF